MRAGLLLLAVFGLTYGAVIHRGGSTRNLEDDLQDFLSVLPIDKIKAIALEHVANDAEVQKAIEYLKSDDFKSIVQAVDNEPETKQLLNFLEESGLDAYNFLNKIHDLLGLPHIEPSRARHSRSIRSLIDEIKAILPIDDIKALYHQKMESSDDFKKLYDTLSSEQFHNFVSKVKALPKVQELVQKLRDHGIDVDAVVDFVKTLFGWDSRLKQSTRNLKDDLQDFLNLLPTDQIKAIALEHVANDAEVQEAIEYLKSDDFKSIVQAVDNEPETKQLLNFLEDSGLDAYDFLNKIHDLLKIPHIEPNRARYSRSIRTLIDEIKAILPIDDIKALYHEKLESSADFKKLYDTLSSEQFHNFVSKVKALPKVQELVQKLKEHGVDVDAVVGFVKLLFGWDSRIKRSTRNLNDDLQDFLKLIPVDQIKAIALEHVANDAEVQKAIEFLKSDDFKSIVEAVDNEPETKQLLNFLEESGIDAYNFLNKIHDLLGLPHIEPTRARHSRSIRTLIDEIKAILPIDDIKALYHEKLESSADFKNLYDTLSSEQFHNFVSKVKALPKVQELVQKLRDHGVDVDAVVDFAKTLFGWGSRLKRSTRNLKDDLQDFLNIIPADKIKAIALEHVANDAEVQKAIEYLKSDDFKSILQAVNNEPETKQLLNFLEDSGLDVYDFLNKILDILQLPHIEPSRARHSRSIRSLIDEIKAILPIDDIKALYHQKMESSEDFKKLYDTLSSEQFHDFVSKVKALPKVQELVQKLRDNDVDVDAVVDFVKTVFGWE